MFEIGERVSFTTDEYNELNEHMSYSKVYIKTEATITEIENVPEQKYMLNGVEQTMIPAHTLYTVETDEGKILQGWGWRLNKLE